jgi:hypothetical protein
MSVRKGISLLFALSALTFLAACGGGGSRVVVVPPPSGGFTSSNFSGTYVFSTTGVDVNGAFLTVVGDLVANGHGGITGGALDVADGASGVSPNNTVTSGSYQVSVDGRGTATLNTAGGTIILDFVLTSSNHGVVTEFDGSGTGSGTLDLQPTVVAQTALTGLTFGFSGVGSTSAFATVGTVTLDSSGNVTAGFEDFNSGGTPTTNAAVLTSSFVTVGSGTAPGTAQLISSLGTFTFDVYAIDSTHLKFIETDNNFLISGDAFAPGTALPVSSTLVFTLAGLDTSGLPAAYGGTLSLDANSNVLAGGLEDFNDGGVVGQDPSFAGGFSAISGGRSVLTLSGFVNGAANELPGTYTFAAYPFVSHGVNGVQLLEIDSTVVNGVTLGAAFVQTSTSLASGQGYGLNLSAINFPGGNFAAPFEEDDIAQFVTTSNSFSGIVDLNDQGSLTPTTTFTGAYTAPSGGRGTATSNFFNGDFYVVNGSTLLFLETDSNQIGLGVIELQNASASPGVAQPAISMLSPIVVPHAAFRRKQ